jgi:hypothetical protein
VEEETVRYDSGVGATATGEGEGPGPLAATAGGEEREETKGDDETQTELNTGETRDEAIEIRDSECGDAPRDPAQRAAGDGAQDAGDEGNGRHDITTVPSGIVEQPSGNRKRRAKKVTYGLNKRQARRHRLESEPAKEAQRPS